MDCAPGGPASRGARACVGRKPCLSYGNHARERGAYVAVDLAIIDDQFAVTALPDDVHVVGGHDDRHANILKSAEQAHDLERKVRIEVAFRLVSDQQRWLADDGTRYADTLLLSNR